MNPSPSLYFLLRSMNQINQWNGRAHKFRRVIVPLKFQRIFLMINCLRMKSFLLNIHSKHANWHFARDAFLLFLRLSQSGIKKNGDINYDGLFLICALWWTKNLFICFKFVHEPKRVWDNPNSSSRVNYQEKKGTAKEEQTGMCTFVVR